MEKNHFAHRDLKLENIMKAANGKYKLIDFDNIVFFFIFQINFSIAFRKNYKFNFIKKFK